MTLNKTPWKLAQRAARMNPSIIREILKVTEQPGVLSLAGGLPSPESFPIEAPPPLNPPPPPPQEPPPPPPKPPLPPQPLPLPPPQLLPPPMGIPQRVRRRRRIKNWGTKKTMIKNNQI